MKRFTKKYEQKKTLCFALKPIGKTLENIEKSGYISHDEKRMTDAELIKPIFDRVHKSIISAGIEKIDREVLTQHILDYFQSMDNKTEYDMSPLRTLISNALKSTEEYKAISTNAKIREVALKYTKNENEELLLASFKGFMLYFNDYFISRNRLYDSEDKEGRIAARLTKDNMPIFYYNYQVMKDVSEDMQSQSLLNELGLHDNLISYFTAHRYPCTQQDIDKYNALIGGITKADGNNHKGVNQLIHEHNTLSDRKIPLLKKLNKLPLYEVQTFSYTRSKFEEEEDVIKAVLECDYTFPMTQMHDVPSNIYVHASAINELSHYYFRDWNYIQRARVAYYNNEFFATHAKMTKQQEAERDSLLKKTKYISIKEINKVCRLLSEEPVHLEHYYEQLVADYAKYRSEYTNLKLMLKKPRRKGLRSDTTLITAIKDMLDTLKVIENRLKTIARVNETDIHTEFYEETEYILERLEGLDKLYNMIRDYITSKPYSRDKIQLTFGTSSFMEGWDRDKKDINLANILTRDGKYYLAIADIAYRKALSNIPTVETEDVYQCLEYKQLAKPNLNLPRIVKAKGSAEEFGITDNILEIMEKGTFKQGPNFVKEDLYTLIDFYKHCLTVRWPEYNHKYPKTETYDNIKQFFDDVERCCYSIHWSKVDKKYIDSMIDKGLIHVFEITSKDLYKADTKKMEKNALLFRALFEHSENVKLNAGAEMYYRKASIAKKDRIIHRANKPMDNKNPDSQRKTASYSYDIIKDKRFTVDQFSIHICCTINAGCHTPFINDEVNQYIKTHEDMHVIGIHRGDNSLIYAVVIDSKGRIVEQKDLSIIVSMAKYGELRYCNYTELLKNREQENIDKKKNWQSAGNIKTLKEGYLSQALYEVTKLMMKYNAVIAIEDLSASIMKDKAKLQRSIYAKFEEMLYRKLNYLVNDKTFSDAPGSVTNGYQLTNNFVSMEKIGIQNGFVFKVSPYMTKSIDTTTGFVAAFDSFNISTKKELLTFLASFTDIRYNGTCYEFLTNASNYRKNYSGKTDWIVTTNGNRAEYVSVNGKKKLEWINLTEEMTRLLKDQNIDITNNLREQILSADNASFYKELVKLFNLAVKMVNDNIIISPVRNKNGTFYISGSQNNLPENADANSAYNIALKCLLQINSIRMSEDVRLKLGIKNEDWLTYMQNDCNPAS